MISYKTFLMMEKAGSTSGTSTFEKLCDIKNFANIGGKPQLLESTTLSDKQVTFEEGLLENAAKEFKANYNLADFKKIDALKGQEKTFQIWFGGTEDASGKLTPTGTDGKYEFKGTISVMIEGAGSNAIVEMVITIVPSSVDRIVA